MFRIIGIIFVSFAAATLIVMVDFFIPGSFLNRFIGSEFIQMFAAILGFNFAAIIFLLGQLFVIDNSERDIFKNTKNEIKQNGVYILSSFSICLLLLIFRPDFNVTTVQFTDNWLFYLINTVIITLFIVSLFAVYEIFDAAFLLTRKQNTKE